MNSGSSSRIVNIACDKYENPSLFWKQFEKPKSNKLQRKKYLVITQINDDSEDDEFGVNIKIINGNL